MNLGGDKGRQDDEGYSSRGLPPTRTKKPLLLRPSVLQHRGCGVGDEGLGLYMEEERLNYCRLREKEFILGRTVDWVVLEELNLKGNVQRYVSVGAWEKFFGINEVTYANLTLEFLATLSLGMYYSDYARKDMVKFQVHGRRYSMSTTEFSVCLGLYDTEYVKTFEYTSLPRTIGADENDFWRSVSKDEKYVASIAKASKLKYPGLRYIHNVLAYTLSGRGNSHGAVTRSDLCYLWSMFEGVPVHVGYMMLHLMYRQVHEKKLTVISVGPFVTRLARGLGVINNVKEVALGEMEGCGFETLERMGVIQKKESDESELGYVWVFVDQDGSPIEEPVVEAEDGTEVTMSRSRYNGLNEAIYSLQKENRRLKRCMMMLLDENAAKEGSSELEEVVQQLRSDVTDIWMPDEGLREVGEAIVGMLVENVL